MVKQVRINGFDKMDDITWFQLILKKARELDIYLKYGDRNEE